MLHRRTIVLLSLLAVILGLAPLVAVVIVSQYWALEAEHDHLTEYAGWTLERSVATLSLAESALDELNGFILADCSAAHIEKLQEITVDNIAVEEVAFYRDGVLRCSSWGQAEDMPVQGGPELALDGGYGLRLAVNPQVAAAQSAMALEHGAYRVLIRPERLVDVLSDTRMTLGVATSDGQLIAVSHPLAPDLVAFLLDTVSAGVRGDDLYATARSNDFTAFAVSTRSQVGGILAGGRWILIPVGVLVSAALVAIVVLLSRQRVSLRAEILSGLRRGEFQVFYQPVIELSSGRCTAAEALIRWQRADGRWTAPDVFVPEAERDELIVQLTEFVIETVVGDLASAAPGTRPDHVAINISSKDIELGRFLDVADRALSAAGLDPRLVWFEVTERGLIDVVRAREILGRAHDAGHAVAIDDFGTGYSSLSVLEQLPLDALKIDKSFVDVIGRSAAASIVTPHIIEMAHSLKLQIVAEGVETEEQARYLASANVEFAQGWFYSRALPFVELCGFIARRNNPGKGRIKVVA